MTAPMRRRASDANRALLVATLATVVFSFFVILGMQGVAALRANRLADEGMRDNRRAILCALERQAVGQAGLEGAFAELGVDIRDYAVPGLGGELRLPEPPKGSDSWCREWLTKAMQGRARVVDRAVPTPTTAGPTSTTAAASARGAARAGASATTTSAPAPPPSSTTTSSSTSTPTTTSTSTTSAPRRCLAVCLPPPTIPFRAGRPF